MIVFCPYLLPLSQISLLCQDFDLHTHTTKMHHALKSHNTNTHPPIFLSIHNTPTLNMSYALKSGQFTSCAEFPCTANSIKSPPHAYRPKTLSGLFWCLNFGQKSRPLRSKSEGQKIKNSRLCPFTIIFWQKMNFRLRFHFDQVSK